MTENMRHWNRFADIDPAFTKPITGKPYRGTSPNPQYVIRCLTEIFGPVGVGFGWTVVAEDFTPMGEEILHWCRIQFWHTDRKNAYDSYGQTKALAKTRNGMLLDEDAPKKSLTDAIVKAASHVGIAANIFLGRWDDQKYVAEIAAEYRAESDDASPKAAPVKAAPAARREDAPDAELSGLSSHMISALRKNGVGVASNEKFQADLKRLSAEAPSLAAAVNAEIVNLKQGKAA